MPKNSKLDDGEFSPKESQQRFEAALKGARIAGHKPMSEVSPKRKPKSIKKPTRGGKPKK